MFGSSQQEWLQRCKAQAEWLGCSANDFWYRPTPEKSVAVRERRKRMANLGDAPVFEMVQGKDGVSARTQVGVKAWSPSA